ncbi:MAG: hypothetical protein EBX40_03510 [Gammaproteobacteria bacterium]|nr:hypothetical protein [Gammaproteobacteria bacterium]
MVSLELLAVEGVGLGLDFFNTGSLGILLFPFSIFPRITSNLNGVRKIFLLEKCDKYFDFNG